MQRRQFIHRMGIGALVTTGSGFPLDILGKSDVTTLTVLHTNDVHSRVEPFPMDGSRNQGLGGVARRAALIQEIRKQADQVLLLDAGDIFQGTPYFNFYGGEIEMKLMSAMQYDAATIGNHDFDAGLEGLIKQLPHAAFPLINCNYDFRDTPMAGKTIPHKIFQKGPVKVGVIGIGIELKGLVPENLAGATQYLDPVSKANEEAAILKMEKKCDLVICLSHLGYRYQENKVSDQVLANNSKNIDIIIGGHTHTFMPKPEIRRNAAGEPVVIHQVGWGGMILGRLDIHFEHSKKKKCVTCANEWVKS